MLAFLKKWGGAILMALSALAGYLFAKKHYDYVKEREKVADEEFKGHVKIERLLLEKERKEKEKRIDEEDIDVLDNRYRDDDFFGVPEGKVHHQGRPGTET